MIAIIAAGIVLIFAIAMKETGTNVVTLGELTTDPAGNALIVEAVLIPVGAARHFFRVEAVGSMIGHIQRVSPAVLAAAQAGTGGLCIKGTDAHFTVKTERAVTLAGEDLDDTTDGIATIQRGGRAAQDFDAFDLAGRQA